MESLDDKVDYVVDSQTEEFVSGLIVTPSPDVATKPKRSSRARSVKRNLADDFDEVALDAPKKRSKFVVLEDD